MDIAGSASDEFDHNLTLGQPAEELTLQFAESEETAEAFGFVRHRDGAIDQVCRPHLGVKPGMGTRPLTTCPFVPLVRTS